MIISASYKTDIPAFYGEWFLNRVNAGFCRMVNAYNRNQHYVVSLSKKDVDGFVFWTKNIGPFMPVLEEIFERGYRFIVQHTINNYPRELEPKIVDHRSTIKRVRQIASRFGPKVLVWRYDPIVFSSLTPEDFHLSNFQKIAEALEGATDEVVVSFLQLYKKTQRNVDRAAETNGFYWHDPSADFKKNFASGLAEIAHRFHIRVTMCSQPELVASGVGIAHCVDAERLMVVSGKRIKVALKGMRPSCGCFRAKDIGEYESCLHGCVYCYANQSPQKAKERFNSHDPQCEYLLPAEAPSSSSGDLAQGSLF